MRSGHATSEFGSLADRASAPSQPVAADPPSPARHCFVHGQSALLVEWRQGSAGWEGRVISVEWLEGGWATVERWVPSGVVSPA